MKRRLFIFIVVVCCWSRPLVYAQSGPEQPTVLRLYEQALRQFNKADPTEESDSLALLYFQKVINKLSPTKLNANTLLASCLNAGILTQIHNKQIQALRFYQKAISTGRQFQLTDTLLFKPYLYAGTAYYHLQSFDSSTYYYKKAEQIYLRYPQLNEAQRLYNSFGVIYYEAGNYQQSINYFQKALQLNQQQAKDSQYFFSQYTSNIASALRHLEQFDSAAALYEKLLLLNKNRKELLINLGATYLEKNDPGQALRYLQQIQKPDSIYALTYENSLARAYIQQRQFDLAVRHLERALFLYKKRGPANRSFKKNKNIGLTYKLLGDVSVEKKQYAIGLQFYQQAIIQLDHEFNEPAINRNPSQFLEGFNSFLLFETIAAKAHCQEQMLTNKASETDIQKAANTYRSALALAGHIEKVFDTEESRLFALKKILPVQQQAITLLIRLHEQTHQESYLEEAFRQSEQSKAAVLYIGRKENESKANTGIPDSLLQRERNLKFTLSQLFMRIDRTTNDVEIAQIRTGIRDANLALSRIADRLHDYPEYYRKKFGADTIDLHFLRHTVLNRKTALLSFFQTDATTYTFVLTRNGLQYHKTPNDATFRKQLVSLVTALRTAVPGERYPADQQAQFIYKSLIKPLEGLLSDYNSLIIIPHDELTQLSFDALEDGQNRYLLERFDITYQYAASFLRPESKPTLLPEQVLAVAPFTLKGLHGDGILGILPASGQELKYLKGVNLANGEATKSRFLQLAKQASIIHLATHAIANNEFPAQSYIAFAPQQNNDDKLYAHELQYGILGQVKLIFLSACETASGQLVRGEGVMSLSRALSYAGCPNLITSLWKAEDNATAYISQRFYEHLDEGNSVARSLQLAKLDLLHNSQYAQFHSPQYWSHLVFVGSPSEAESISWLWILAGITGIFLISGAIWKKLGQKKITVIVQ